VNRAGKAVSTFALAAVTLMTSSPVSAQAPAAAEDRGYVQAVADSAFGNVTSQSYGAEAGFTVRPNLQVFGSFGHIGNVATEELSAAAQSIAGAVSQVQSGTVSFSVKEPATFFVGGVRYRFPVMAVLKPYVSGGLGVASVSKDTKFFINGTDASSTLPQYVTLGLDVSGDESALMFTFGGGVVWPAWRQLIIDLHYMYGHISSDAPVNVSRAGVGIGVRF
jgi:opacity protein-like surface antigen